MVIRNLEVDKYYTWKQVRNSLCNVTILVTDRKFIDGELHFKLVRILEDNEYDYGVVQMLRNTDKDLVSYYVTPDSWPDNNMCIRYGSENINGKEYPIYSIRDIEYAYPDKYIIHKVYDFVSDSRVLLCTFMEVVEEGIDEVERQFSYGIPNVCLFHHSSIESSGVLLWR